eukprot:CAMPEP_0183352770 /NCGR_PEP_ID=MMETSP0164_2-20130417/30344_1 /TAXON_ID=221442 /ORGANISM="Coccolithus pelagicus ssp braarudi, Strain PLY182g" /LENGTH=125 /DNA_ID=CAMNT_0025525299 /DNA_START=602 /DNA_END=975 /DNA_ORIENTATION=-
MIELRCSIGFISVGFIKGPSIRRGVSAAVRFLGDLGCLPPTPLQGPPTAAPLRTLQAPHGLHGNFSFGSNLSFASAAAGARGWVAGGQLGRICTRITLGPAVEQQMVGAAGAHVSDSRSPITFKN